MLFGWHIEKVLYGSFWLNFLNLSSNDIKTLFLPVTVSSSGRMDTGSTERGLALTPPEPESTPMNQFRQPYSLTESIPRPHKHSLASERIVNSPLWWQNTIYNSTFPWEHLKCSSWHPIKIPSQYKSQLLYTPLHQLGFDREMVRASFLRPFASVVMSDCFGHEEKATLVVFNV